MPYSFEQSKDEIAKLVKHFLTNQATYRAPAYKEAHARLEFIDPFFMALNWDVQNRQFAAPDYREVIAEDSLDIEGQKKAPDYAFRIGRERKFFAEAKKPGVDLKTAAAPAYQLRRYAWSAKLPLSILSDFEELSVYDCRLRPNEKDKPSVARVNYLKCEEYADHWRDIWDVFSRDAVWSGSFDQFTQTSKGKRGTSEVDSEFLKEIEGWRDVLAKNIAFRNTRLTIDELNDAVQRTIDRLIFLRMAEDRGIEEYGQLQRLAEGEDIYSELLKLSRKADAKYNSGLFDFTKAGDTVIPKLAVDDKTLRPILAALYYPQSPYEFSVLPAEILGNVYEQFLGKVIRLTPSHNAKVEEKPEVRKAGGVYYTPTYIVEYIVRHTVGQQIEGKSPKQLKGFRVLDPACGSGSFLLGVYKFLLDYYQTWYAEHTPEKHPNAVREQGGAWRLTTGEKKRILTEHIFGVDIDRQAVEVTKLSLLLKVLEGESDETLGQQLRLFQERALPNLDQNIKCGNSLIGPDYFSDQLMADPDELRRVNPFDWAAEFPEAMQAGGFDCVIGNPPYINIENIDERDREHFVRVFGEQGKLGKRYDIYQVFTLKGMSLLKPKGLLGFILPNTFLMGHSYSVLRKRMAEQTAIVECVDLPQGVFKGVTVDNVLLFLRLEHSNKERQANQIVIYKLAPKSDKSRVGTAQWDESFNVPQARLRAENDFKLNVHTNPQQAELFEKIESGAVQLGEVTESSQGIILYKTAGDAEKSEYTGTKERKGWKRLLRGKNIGRYEMKWGAEYVHYGSWLWCARDEKFFASPKILLQAMRNKSLERRLIGTYDVERYYNAHNLANIIAKPNLQYDLRFVLGLFNSRLLNYWYKAHFPNVNINPNDFRQLPIRPINFDDSADKARHDKMVTLVDQMLDLHKRKAGAKDSAEESRLQRLIDSTDKQIDALVYELYGLSPEEIAVVENGSKQNAA